MITASKAQAVVQNDLMLERVSAIRGVVVRSFDGWKAAGRWVRKGQKQKAFRVQWGTRTEENPITGEAITVPIFRTCYGFTEDQVN